MVMLKHTRIEQFEHSVPLFSGLKTDDITHIMAAATVQRFAKHQNIAREDHQQTHLGLVKTGSVDVYRVTSGGQKVPITKLLPGEAFGLGTLFSTDETYPARGDAIDAVEIYTWVSAKARQFAKEFPTLIENAILITLDRLLLCSDRYAAMVSAENRLTHELLHVGLRMGRRTTKGLEVQTTDEDLASPARADLDTAHELFDRWKKNGAIEKTRQRIVICNPEIMVRTVADAIHALDQVLPKRATAATFF
jgi:CRP-like cAMP-binding protein